MLATFAALFLLPSTQGMPQWNGPAFLDASDKITVWVPTPGTKSGLSGAVTVTANGKPVPVRHVEGVGVPVGQMAADSVTLPGTLQSKLGGSDWNPGGPEVEAQRIRDGVYDWIGRLPAGRYQFKVARGGSWSENYGREFQPGGENIVLNVPTEGWVRVRVDFNAKTVKSSVDLPGEVPVPTEGPAAQPRIEKFQSFRVHLARSVAPKELKSRIVVRVDGGPERRVFARNVLSEAPYQYAGNDLGPVWTPKGTTFKVWSPVSSQVTLLAYRGSRVSRYPMAPQAKGVWSLKLPGDQHGLKYEYELKSYGETRRAADVYAKAATADSRLSLVIDLRKTNPAGWPAPRIPGSPDMTRAVIYEAHVRDLTAHPSSNVRAEWRGKYLGLTESGPNQPLTHLKRLGVTHLHLLPFQNFNPGNSKNYNWGYETTLFNVPEEQYSTKPEDPLTTIRETKAMIAGLQKAGIGVVLDVVYNHSVPSQGPGSAFWEMAPYFYFRTNDRGDVLNESGVGNALNDEQFMARKFIADSLEFWAKEYRLDGFRFDLIGMFTRESNISFAKAIRRVNPNAVVYGEPWTGGGPNRFPKGAQRGTGVAVFNDHFRNVFRGGLDDDRPGFISGGSVDFDSLKLAIQGSVDDFADSPAESINYISAHDNMTLRDKIAKAMPGATSLLKERAVKLAQTATLLSHGIPFLEGGVEIGRTKGGNENSYNKGDAVNQFRWDLAPKHQSSFKHLAHLIQLRKNHRGFATMSASTARRAIVDADVFKRTGVLLYGVQTRDSSTLWVALNGTMKPHQVSLPRPGPVQIISEGASVVDKSGRSFIELQPLGQMVFLTSQ